MYLLKADTSAELLTVCPDSCIC